MEHHVKTSAHPGGRRMYYSIRRDYYWPSMAVDCYNTVRNCMTCAKNRVKLRKHTRHALARRQARYKHDYDAQTRVVREEFPVGSHVFVRKEHWNEEEEEEPKRHKLAPIADGPFEVQGSDADTVVISYRDGIVERISKD